MLTAIDDWRVVMKLLLLTSILVLFYSSFCFPQEPVMVLSSNWQRTTHKGKVIEPQQTAPARAMINENKNFQRNAREQQSPGAIDPNEMTVDGRSAALEKINQQARTAKTDDVIGYTYSANVRNNSGKTAEIIFWEYRFAEIANPSNVVRRQFLCSAKLKNGASKELSVFSSLGPSEVIDADSLARSTTKLFDETVLVNRIEFSDGAILQRNNWKFDDVKKDVERVTSTPWGNETCRAL